MASSPKRFLRNYAIYFSVWTVFALFFSSQTMAQKVITGEKTPVSHYVLSWLDGMPKCAWTVHTENNVDANPICDYLPMRQG